MYDYEEITLIYPLKISFTFKPFSRFKAIFALLENTTKSSMSFGICLINFIAKFTPLAPLIATVNFNFKPY